MRYRLAVFDIDGTLVGSSRKLSPATIAAVRGLAAKGVLIAAATARPYEVAIPTLAPVASSLSALIAAAGADIRRGDGEPIARTVLPHESARALAALCDQQDWPVTAGTAEGAFRRLSRGERAKPGSRAAAVASLAAIPLDRAFIIAPFAGASHPAFGALEALVHDGGLRGERALSSTGRELLAVTNAAAGKGPALRRLCDAIGVAPAQTAAFGDTEVDLRMLDLAGLGVAMGDAPAAVKAVAGIVTGTADEDGAAAAIHRIWGPL